MGIHPTNKELVTPLNCRSIKSSTLQLLESPYGASIRIVTMDPETWKNETGRPRKTFIDQLVKDTECVLNELPAAMEDRSGWKKRCC